VSFHDEHALRLGVEHAVTRGDVSMFAAIHAEQTAHNGYSIAEALAESAVESAKNGHADALVAMCTVFASDRSYGARTMVRIAWTLAETGEIALARRVIEATRDACLEEVSGHDRFLAVIETPFAHPAKVPTGRALVQYIRVGHRIDPEGASALAQQRESALLSAITATSASVSQAVEELGFLGVAIAAAGLRDRGGALLSTAIQAAQTLDRGAMSSVLKTLALAAVEHGLGEQAHAAFKKIATKSYKVEVAQALSVLYVQDGDFAGASMILANGDPRPIWQMMRHCDALSIAAGTERAFLNHV
jgi:hypothetical protein